MKAGLRFNFWIGSALKAQLEAFSLRLGKTQGWVLRQALVGYLANHIEGDLEKKHGELSMAKRIREMLESFPKDTHDGVMLVARVDEVIQKQIMELRKRGWLEVEDFDHFIRLVKENKNVIQTYAEGDWLCRKLDMLIAKLERERKELEEEKSKSGSGR